MVIKMDLIIGSHVSFKKDTQLVGSVNETLGYNANTFMFYTGAPQNTSRYPIDNELTNKALELMKENNIDIKNIIVHAPYIVNLAQQDSEKFNFAVKFLSEELKKTDLIGAKYMVLHPGAHVGSGSHIGVNRIANGINQMLDLTSEFNSVITLETMAGKGTECGRNFEEIAAIIDQIDNKDRIAVCLDTCHINDAGYDLVNNYENVINEFDKIIGLKYLKVIHINDSKNPLNAKKDRHENIGFGHIGFDTIVKICNDERFKDIPKILETPYIDITDDLSVPPYKEEIKMIKEGFFNPNIKDIIKNAH